MIIAIFLLVIPAWARQEPAGDVDVHRSRIFHRDAATPAWAASIGRSIAVQSFSVRRLRIVKVALLMMFGEATQTSEKVQLPYGCVDRLDQT